MEDEKNTHRVKFLQPITENSTTFYNISITTSLTKESWLLKERYSRIRQIHEQIAKTYKVQLPVFPPKKWPGNLDPNFVSQRQKALENYLNTVLKTINLDDIDILKKWLYSTKNNDKKPIPVVKPKIVPPINSENQIPNPVSYPKQNYDQIVGLIKFVDMSSNLNPPEDEDIKAKRIVYEQIKMNINSQLIDKRKYPRIKFEKLLINEELNRQSVSTIDGSFVNLMELCVKNIEEKFENPDIKILPNLELIHTFSGAANN